VSSLGRPKGNVTAVTLIGVELSTLNGEAILPPCSSNVYQLLAEQLPNPNMFDVVGDAAVNACCDRAKELQLSRPGNPASKSWPGATPLGGVRAVRLQQRIVRN
jgi:hypothetical protein